MDRGRRGWIDRFQWDFLALREGKGEAVATLQRAGEEPLQAFSDVTVYSKDFLVPIAIIISVIIAVALSLALFTRRQKRRKKEKGV